jgi:hypothetical protein
LGDGWIDGYCGGVEIFGRKRIAAPAGCCTNMYISIDAVVL